MMRKTYEFEEIHAPMIFSHRNFFGVQFHFKAGIKKIADFSYVTCEKLSVPIQNYKIIAIAHIIFRPEVHFYELVELVQVDVCEKLAREVAERQSFARFFIKAVNDYSEKIEGARVFDSPCKEIFKYLVIDRVEKTFDIAFQNPNGFRIIPR